MIDSTPAAAAASAGVDITPVGSEESKSILSDSQQSLSEGEVAIENYLDYVGGLYQWVALVGLGLANAADSAEMMVISFIMDDFGFSDTLQGVLSGSLFAGMLVGGLLSGLVADNIGRRPCLLMAMATNLVFGIGIAAFPHTWEWLFFCRVMAGVGVGGTVPVMFTMCAEIVGPKYRGPFITAVCSFWMLGGLYTAGACWLLLGHYKLFWIYGCFASQLPNALAMLIVLLFVKETPKYYYTKRDFLRARAVLRVMAKRNDKSYYDPFADIETRPRSETSDVDNTMRTYGPPDTVDALGSTTSSVPKSAKPTKYFSTKTLSDLFLPHLRLTTVSLVLAWFALSFGWYGIILWIPKLFKKYNAGFSAYSEAFLVQVANLPGNIVSVLCVDRVGRNRLLSISMFISCGICAAMGFQHTLHPIVVLACCYNGVSIIGWNCLSCVSSEMFPTYLRSSAVGFLSAIGRVASGLSQLAFGLMFHYDASTSAILFSAAGMMSIGAFSTLYLDYAKRRDVAPGVSLQV